MIVIPGEWLVYSKKITRTRHSVKDELNIMQYELFILRDTGSINDKRFYQFRILKDDYSPKPAFYAFCNQAKELGKK
ncbi:MAG: hypothetical protein ABI691_05925 [Ginsengibacter sp.]